ncbi:HPP family protein [Microbispora sp. NPDC046933]|uniref:HPP family protein n=1 Tax=Microbispora sp. NPDC046933 TaxID=3155618 RepID=UPI0033FA1024
MPPPRVVPPRRKAARQAVGTAVQAALCIAVPAVIACLTGQPFVFPSLGPTIFLALTAASAPTASPRNTVLGHLVSATAGYTALTVTGLTRAGANLSHPDGRRVAAVAVALLLASAGMLLGDVWHPPGGATTLIVALGLLRTPSQLLVLMAAVITTSGVLVAVNRLCGRLYPVWAVRLPPEPPKAA